ncbi:MAG TPA: hypothetical protein VFS22_09790 [Flavisolibacter sp.]|nr:hypothetical protein [Flavisolibacter sp.]
MKLFLLSVLLSLAVLSSKAQNVNNLPAGKYETIIKNNGKWDKGDIVLLDEGHYKITSSDETGEYRFSVTAQRLFFTSGPLKGIFAKTTQSNNVPAILIPLTENQQLGLKLASADILGYLKH